MQATNATLHRSVTVQAPPPILYQWRKNGVDIPGATAASLTLASATLADNGAKFSVVVSNDRFRDREKAFPEARERVIRLFHRIDNVFVVRVEVLVVISYSYLEFAAEP